MHVLLTYRGRAAASDAVVLPGPQMGERVRRTDVSVTVTGVTYNPWRDGEPAGRRRRGCRRGRNRFAGQGRRRRGFDRIPVGYNGLL